MHMATTEKKHGRMILYSGLIWAFTYIAGLGILKETHPPQALGIVIAVLPALGFAWFLYHYMRGITSMDELERSIQLEATAVAFCLCVLMLMVLGLLGLVVELNQEDWSHRHLVPFAFLFYFIGLYRARRKYA
jgi:hypothetical protein